MRFDDLTRHEMICLRHALFMLHSEEPVRERLIEELSEAIHKRSNGDAISASLRRKRGLAKLTIPATDEDTAYVSGVI